MPQQRSIFISVRVSLWITIAYCMLFNPLRAANDKGSQLYEEEHYPEAKAFYEKYLNSPHHKAAAQYNLGCIAYQEQDYAQAQEAFEAALHTSQPELQEKIFYNLGNTAFQQASKANTPSHENIPYLEAAIKAYSNSLDLNPNNFKAIANRELAQKELQRLKDQEKSRQEAENRTSEKQNPPKEKPQEDSKTPSQNQKKESDPETAQGASDSQQEKANQNTQNETHTQHEPHPKSDKSSEIDNQDASSKAPNNTVASAENLKNDTQVSSQSQANTTTTNNTPSQELSSQPELSSALPPKEDQTASALAKMQEILESSKKREQKLHFQQMGSAGASAPNTHRIKDW